MYGGALSGARAARSGGIAALEFAGASTMTRWPLSNSLTSRVHGDRHLGFVAGPERVDNRPRREHFYPVDTRQADPVLISVGCPAKEQPIRKQIGLVVIQDEGTGGEVADGFRERYFHSAEVDPLLMQHFVDLPDRGSFGIAVAGIGFEPEVFEPVESLAATFGAWPVTCRKGGGFVEEEEFGIAIRCHDGPSSPLEIEQADQPRF